MCWILMTSPVTNRSTLLAIANHKRFSRIFQSRDLKRTCVCNTHNLYVGSLFVATKFGRHHVLWLEAQLPLSRHRSEPQKWLRSCWRSLYIQRPTSSLVPTLWPTANLVPPLYQEINHVRRQEIIHNSAAPCCKSHDPCRFWVLKLIPQSS